MIERMRDWINCPEEWGSFGTRANTWFNAVATAIRFSEWVSDSGLSTFTRTEDATGRVEDRYELGGASTLIETIINGVRIRLQDETTYVEYENDGSTALFSLDRVSGTVAHHSIRTGTPSYTANWANFGGVFGTVSLTKTADGVVHITGTVQNISGGAIAAASSIFTAPVGFRPLVRRIYPVVAAASQFARVDVYPTGVVEYNVGPNVPAGGFVALNISYFAGF